MQLNRIHPALHTLAGLPLHQLVQDLMAVDKDDERARASLLDRCRADLHARDRHGNGVLHLAAAMGCGAHVVRALVSAGADPLAVNHHGDTALHIAASRANGDRTVVGELLSAGGLALADCTDRQRRTALDRARQYGAADVVDAMIGDIHLLERCTAWRDHPLGAHWARLVAALEHAGLYAVQDAVWAVGGANAIDPRGVPVLFRAADAGRDDVVAWLLESGAKPNEVYRSARTGITCSALMLALPYPAVTRLLLAWGANALQASAAATTWWNRPQSVLHLAAKAAAPDSMAALLDAQPRKAWHDADLAAALTTALRENLPRVAAAILEYTGKLNARTMGEALPLAVRTGDAELVHLVLALAGGSLDARTVGDARAIAVARDDRQMIALLGTCMPDGDAGKASPRPGRSGGTCTLQ